MRATIKSLVFALAVLAIACSSAPTPGPEDPGATASSSGEDMAKPPSVVLTNLSTCGVTLTLRPTAAGERDPGPGLRSVLLHVEGSARLEPHATWTDGSPVSADAALTADAMRGLVDGLARSGFFGRAVCYTEGRRPQPTTGRPPGTKEGPPERVRAPHLEMEVMVHDEDWYHRFVVAEPLGEEALAGLDTVSSALQGDAVELVAALSAQISAPASTD